MNYFHLFEQSDCADLTFHSFWWMIHSTPWNNDRASVSRSKDYRTTQTKYCSQFDLCIVWRWTNNFKFEFELSHEARTLGAYKPYNTIVNWCHWKIFMHFGVAVDTSNRYRIVPFGNKNLNLKSMKIIINHTQAICAFATNSFRSILFVVYCRVSKIEIEIWTNSIIGAQSLGAIGAHLIRAIIKSTYWRCI